MLSLFTSLYLSTVGADKSPFWELDCLCAHFHPTVRLFARHLSENTPIKYGGDPLNDFTVAKVGFFLGVLLKEGVFIEANLLYLEITLLRTHSLVYGAFDGYISILSI